MDGFLYPFSLLFIAIMAFLLNRANHFMLMLIVLAAGVYIVYTHETGHTATDFKNEMVESLDKSARGYSETHGTEGYDANKSLETVK